MYVCCSRYLPMARKQKGTFVKCASTEVFLEQGIDKIYNLIVKTTIETQKGNRYVSLDVNLSADAFRKVLALLVPKRVHWTEWIPPTAEDEATAKAKGYQKAFGRIIPYDGVVE